MGEVFKLNQLHGESSSLVRNWGSDYSLAHVPERLLIAWISKFLKNELWLSESEYTEKLKNWVETEVSKIIGEWLDTEIIQSVWLGELKKILEYRFSGSNTKPFFIIWSDSIKQKTWFTYELTRVMPDENWYMLVNPVGTSHIILPTKKQWIRFNGTRQIIQSECNWDAWSYGWWTFQSDKFTSRNHVIYSTISPETIMQITNEVFN